MTDQTERHPLSRLTDVRFLRYVFVGLALNATMYLVYLVVTALWLSPMAAASVLFWVAVPLSYASHSKVTFEEDRLSAHKGARFAVAYLSGYALNLGGLWVGVDLMHLPHQAVQAFLTFAVAGWLFLLQKFWVFRR